MLVDTSIWQKPKRSNGIAAHLRAPSSQHLVMTCPPQVLEYCHPAQNANEYAELRGDMDNLLPTPTHSTAGRTRDIHQALWDRGQIRAAGAFDCLLAAYAVVNDAIDLEQRS